MTQVLTTSVVMSLFLMLTSIIFLFLTSSWTDQTLYTAQANASLQARLNTGIAISSVTDTGLSCSTYAVVIKNNGETAVDDFSKMDVLVDYLDGAGAKVASRLAYQTGWSVTSITPDTRDPNDWNPQETTTFSFTTNPPQDVETSGTVIFVTPGGISDLSHFICWWDTSYTYRQRITVTTGVNSPQGGYNGYTARLTNFDSASLVSSGKLQSDCDDLRVIWWNSTSSTLTELDRDILSCNNSSTEIRFKLQADISASSSDNNYFLYYGNGAVGAGPATLANVYLWYDSAASDQLASYVLGRGDPWHDTGYQAFSHNTVYEVDAGDNFTGSMRRQVSERDAFIEAEFQHTACYPDNMTTGLLGRYVLNSGTADSEESVHYYATNRAHQTACGAGYSRDGDIMKNERGTVAVAGSDPGAIVTGQWRKQALALWSVNATNAKFWDADTVSGFGPRGWPTVGANASGTDPGAGDMESSGDWGVIAAQDDVEVRNILIRRYTEPEPTTTTGPEKTQQP